MTSKKEDIRFIQGNQACAEGALAAGCRFFAGYPITPATEVAERMSRRLPQVDGVLLDLGCGLLAWGVLVLMVG